MEIRFDEEGGVVDGWFLMFYLSDKLNSWCVCHTTHFFFSYSKAKFNLAVVTIESEHSTQYLAHSRCSINILSINDNPSIHRKEMQDQEYV